MLNWISLFVLFWTQWSFAEVAVFDVRQNLAMSDSDKVYRDFYLNGGSEAGLKPGQVITLQRRLPLYDNYANHAAGELNLLVAKVKIIHVQKGLAVARLHSELAREDVPFLEDNYIMVGDILDIQSATADNSVEAVSSTLVAQDVGPQILVNTVELPTAPTSTNSEN